VDISFGIVIAESFLRNFRVEEAQSSVMNRFLQDANDELFLFRDEFYRDTLKEIGVDADPETTISKLISIGILRNVSMSQLLDVYLKSRKAKLIM
jgi:hypothetical protein